MYYLKYHLTSACLISMLLLFILFIIDLLTDTTQLAQLLINIDFIIPKQFTPLWLAILIHLIIGIVVYMMLLLLYRVRKQWYAIGYVASMLSFIVLYPFLIHIAVRPIFHFSWSEYSLWLLAHIIFIVCVARSIPFIDKR